MSIKYLASFFLASFLLVACDDTTDGIGSSLTGNTDKLEISTDTFVVTTRSVVADSVLSRNVTGYLGKVKDPETGVYLTSDFMTQFYCPEDYRFPEKDSIKSVYNGNIAADSCDIRLYYSNFYGDSLAAMKVSARELLKAIPESKHFYSNFNPETEGYVSNDGINVEKVYTLTDLDVDEATRKGSDYIPSIRIPLDKPYKGYNNFGTYIMHQYYANPESFKNSYAFIHDLVPGFYFKTKAGLGSMAYISLSQLNIYFKHKTKTTDSDGNERDTIITSTAAFPGTEEVLQTSYMSNSQAAINRLAEENTCSYIKSPAGIFTEVTLPVDEILANHKNDSINTAKIVFTRINNNHSGGYALPASQTLLMVPKGEMHAFFEQNKIADYKTTFLASFSSSSNTYTFNNIGSLVKYLYDNADRSNADWNKVLLVPVQATYTTVNQVAVLTKVVNDMSLSTTKLVGGSNNPNADIKISVIYSKFKE